MKQTCILIAAALVCFCRGAPHHGRPSQEGVTVFVSILPQKYFVDRISGGLVNCLVMVPPGADPHSYEPHPAQMALLSNAKAYFAIGMEFEAPWLPRLAANATGMRIVHTDSAVQKIPSVDKDDRPAGPGRTDGGAGLDPHIWLSPALVERQVPLIAAALEQIDAAHADEYRRNCGSFLQSIDSLDRELRAVLSCSSTCAAGSRKAFLVFHPSWGYFARDYCLRQVAIEVEGKEPGPRTMRSILDSARIFKIHSVFVQPEFSRTSAQVVARELGAGLIDADPLAYDWKNNLLYMARKIAEQ